MKLIASGLLTAFLLLSTLVVHAQKEGNIWFLNHTTTLNLNFQPPKLITNASNVSEYDINMATIADQNGNLLFYSDGIEVCDRNNNVMPKGADIAKPAIQSVVIVPQPKSDHVYYVITSAVDRNYVALAYTTIGMSLPAASPMGFTSTSCTSSGKSRLTMAGYRYCVKKAVRPPFLEKIA